MFMSGEWNPFLCIYMRLGEGSVNGSSWYTIQLQWVWFGDITYKLWNPANYHSRSTIVATC